MPKYLIPVYSSNPEVSPADFVIVDLTPTYVAQIRARHQAFLLCKLTDPDLSVMKYVDYEASVYTYYEREEDFAELVKQLDLEPEVDLIEAANRDCSVLLPEGWEMPAYTRTGGQDWDYRDEDGALFTDWGSKLTLDKEDVRWEIRLKYWDLTIYTTWITVESLPKGARSGEASQETPL